MTRHLKKLLLGTLALWAVAAYPAYRLGGRPAFVYSLAALALTLVPAGAAAAWREWAFQRSPEQQLLGVLGGSGLRMAAALGAGMGLYFLVPYFQATGFWIWVLVFYLLTLGLEIGLILAEQDVPAGH